MSENPTEEHPTDDEALAIYQNISFDEAAWRAAYWAVTAEHEASAAQAEDPDDPEVMRYHAARATGFASVSLAYSAIAAAGAAQ